MGRERERIRETEREREKEEGRERNNLCINNIHLHPPLLSHLL